jgi:hypothetical protein
MTSRKLEVLVAVLTHHLAEDNVTPLQMAEDKIHVLPIPDHAWEAAGDEKPDKIIVYCAFPSSNNLVEAACSISFYFYNIGLTGVYLGSPATWHQNAIRPQQHDHKRPQQGHQRLLDWRAGQSTRPHTVIHGYHRAESAYGMHFGHGGTFFMVQVSVI